MCFLWGDVMAGNSFDELLYNTGNVCMAVLYFVEIEE
jgi:hypothetical protein